MSAVPAGGDAAAIATFIRAQTKLETPPLVPEIALYLASEVVPLWQMTEEQLAEHGLPPPFWAFAWAGGQALARYILDHPETVAGRAVLDFGSGSGLVGIAAAKAGAARVLAADIDAFAVAAAGLNATENRVVLATTDADLIGQDDLDAEVILAGDICYERGVSAAIETWLRGLAARGKTVLIGDPGRTYMPRDGMRELTTYQVATSRDLEDSAVRRTSVWHLVSEN